MEIPYAYLILDGNVYFQPQNSGKDKFTVNSDDRMFSVRASSHSVVSHTRNSGVLYINGDDPNHKYDLVKFSRTVLIPFLRLIKEHNARLNNV